LVVMVYIYFVFHIAPNRQYFIAKMVNFTTFLALRASTIPIYAPAGIRTRVAAVLQTSRKWGSNNKSACLKRDWRHYLNDLFFGDSRGPRPWLL